MHKADGACTDFHPDRFYKVYTSTSDEAACHRGHGSAGIYGAEKSDCDSPVDLINKTFDWIEKELKDSVDFVVWTGDSARHDNDEENPRSDSQVMELNEFLVSKMFDVFGKRNGDENDDDPNNDYIVPIIPTLGNNDILPHNIFRQGPNKWTRTYARMWRQFIPEEQRHQFEQGGWFYVEVIRNRLAVFSINTLYYFKSNAAVDGCAIPSEPGYEQMEWLRIQLHFMRERGMKVILTGHVPPVRSASKWSWQETCWQKHTLWLHQYRDVIVGSLYGHFNYDHFFLHDVEELRKGTKKGRMPDYDGPSWLKGDIDATVSSSYFTELRDEWASLPDTPESLEWPRARDPAPDTSGPLTGFWHSAKDTLLDMLKSKKKKRKEEEKQFWKTIGGEYAERYAASFVSASVVPNLFPTVRVFEYNITGLSERAGHGTIYPSHLLEECTSGLGDTDLVIAKKRYKFKRPDPPSKSTPPGPAYSPQTFSFTRYTQYFANLTLINNDLPETSSPPSGNASLSDIKQPESTQKGSKPYEQDATPDPKRFSFEKHYDTRDDEVYQLPDLTMPNLVDLARRVGKFKPLDEDFEASQENDVRSDKSKKKKDKQKAREKQRELNTVWWAFVRRAHVDTLSEQELEEEFGT